MSNVVTLSKFRQKSKKSWMERHETRLDLFVREFMQLRMGDVFDLDLQWIFSSSCLSRESANNFSWDYVDARTTIKDAIRDALGNELESELQRQWWYDRRWASPDQLIDKWLSDSIMGFSRESA